jgi:hypothetical protein
MFKVVFEGTRIDEQVIHKVVQIQLFNISKQESTTLRYTWKPTLIPIGIPPPPKKNLKRPNGVQKAVTFPFLGINWI